MAKLTGKAKQKARAKARNTTNASANLNWSEQHYSGLTADQHKANNEWFAQMQRLTKPGGQILVPGLGKSFTN